MIEALEEKTYKEKLLNKKLTNDIFNMLIVRFKLNYLVKFHNKCCLLYEQLNNKQVDIECQIDEKDFNEYLRIKNFLIDEEIDTQDLHDFIISSSTNLFQQDQIKKKQRNKNDKEMMFSRNKSYDSNTLYQKKYYGLNSDGKIIKNKLDSSEIANSQKDEGIDKYQIKGIDTLIQRRIKRTNFVELNLKSTHLYKKMNSEEDNIKFSNIS